MKQQQGHALCISQHKPKRLQLCQPVS